MKTTFSLLLAGLLVCGCSHQPAPIKPDASSPASSDEVAQLARQVDQLERQVQEINQLLEPMKAQLVVDSRRKALRARFEEKTTQDREKYTQDQLRDAERLYQVANQKWGSPEASESLQAMIEKYPDINRTGCAVLYMAQMSQGGEREKYLQDCIEKYNNCWYGDGVQVGAYARYLLARDYQQEGDKAKAEALMVEIQTKYADAIDHRGHLLADNLKTEDK